ncbi:MAG: spore maturation protein A [Merdibacter sp.]
MLTDPSHTVVKTPRLLPPWKSVSGNRYESDWILLILASLAYGLLTGSVSREPGRNAGAKRLRRCRWWRNLFLERNSQYRAEVGLLNMLQKLLSPLLRFLFPDLRDDPEALGYIAANITINVFGLGSAATPSGLKAMECMQRHNPDKKTASRAMVTFLVLNTAGVTILSTTTSLRRSGAESDHFCC